MIIRCVLVDFGNVIAFFDHRKACRELAALSSVPLAIDEVYAANETMATTIRALKARGLGLVLASNTNELHYDWFGRLFAETLSLFDAHVLSYQVGSRKPERPFFEACLTAAGCPASACLYVDDRADFVAAGRALGMTGLVYAPGVDVEAETCY